MTLLRLFNACQRRLYYHRIGGHPEPAGNQFAVYTERVMKFGHGKAGAERLHLDRRLYSHAVRSPDLRKNCSSTLLWNNNRHCPGLFENAATDETLITAPFARAGHPFQRRARQAHGGEDVQTVHVFLRR